MDASSVSSAQQSDLALQIQIAVLRKSQDNAKLCGAAINKLLDSAANLSRSLSTGEAFDAQA